MTTAVPRQRTAMTRIALSRPPVTALDDGILNDGTVFGCSYGYRPWAPLGLACRARVAVRPKPVLDSNVEMTWPVSAGSLGIGCWAPVRYHYHQTDYRSMMRRERRSSGLSSTAVLGAWSGTRP